jgi:hypothetical protein
MQQQRKHKKMQKKEENKGQAVPVVKQLARLMAKDELVAVSGAVSYYCGDLAPPDQDRLN